MATMQSAGFAHALPAHATFEELPRKYVIELDVPDFTAPELQLEVQNGVVTLTGDQAETELEAAETFRLHERLEESFRLPDDVDGERIAAYYDRGTLELHAPKRQVGSLRRIPILQKPQPGVLIDAEATPC